ncbi:MAG: hypothetical protein ACK5MQ_13520 [Pikeienuella sp.]
MVYKTDLAPYIGVDPGLPGGAREASPAEGLTRNPDVPTAGDSPRDSRDTC